MPWGWLVPAGLIFVAVRFAFLEYRLRYLKRIHPRWVASVMSRDDEPHLTAEDIPYLRRFLLEAGVGIEDVSFTDLDVMGYGFVQDRRLPLVDNLLVPQKRFVEAANQKMYEAMGAYRMKRNDTVNPMRWAITLWNLPKAVAKALGANQEAWPMKVVQLIYRVAVIAGIVMQALSAIS